MQDKRIFRTTLQIHWGLDDASVADSIIIEWPSGIRQVLENQNANQHLIITEDTTLTSVGDHNEVLRDYCLYQNYPNPFNPVTRIDFRLESAAEIKLYVFNQLGELIENLYEGYKDAGRHSIEFRGESHASNVYFYTLKTPGFIQSKKMILLK